MKRTGRLALLLTLLFAAAPAPASASQGRGRGLNTREFETQTPEQKQAGGPSVNDERCLGVTGGGGAYRGGAVAGPSGAAGPPCPPYEHAPAWYLSFYDFDLLEVSDAQGNTDRLYEYEAAPKRVDNAVYHSLCGDKLCVMVVVSTGRDFTFKFKSTGRPMRLDLVRGVGNTRPDAAVRYLDLNLPRGAWALLQLTPQGLEDLRVDADGDGRFEATVRPNGSAGGPAARDTRGPVVAFDGRARGTGSVVVSLSAEDVSGVESLRYSLDGRRFDAYAGPFEVDPARVREVWAFADDKLGNRSGLYVFDARTGRRRTLP